jgi:leucyl-tRNA synthetase
MENLKFNVAISDMMIFINECYKVKSLNKKYIYNFLIILSCFAPHICEEINFNILKNKTSINFSK